MSTFDLNGSVGKDGVNNSTDVLAVKSRLADLGFPVPKDSGAMLRCGVWSEEKKRAYPAG